MTINAKRQHVKKKANVRMKMYLNVKMNVDMTMRSNHKSKQKTKYINTWTHQKERTISAGEGAQEVRVREQTRESYQEKSGGRREIKSVR